MHQTVRFTLLEFDSFTHSFYFSVLFYALILLNSSRKKGCPRNIISFDKEKFVNQISDELYTRLNKSMIDYFNEKI